MDRPRNGTAVKAKVRGFADGASEPGPSPVSRLERGSGTSCRAPGAARERPATRSAAWQPPRRPRRPATCSCCMPASTRGSWVDQPERHAGQAHRLARPGRRRWHPAVIDGQGASPSRPAHAIEAPGTHDVWFEDLTIQNAMHGVTFHDAARIVVRRCHILEG